MSKDLKQKSPDNGQITSNAAIIYEDFFVPAIFQEWPEKIMEAANIKEDESVLDVACGTGILARIIAQKVKPVGEITGIDLNQDMLKIASQKAPEIHWEIGSAESLPFEDQKFNAVVSQFGLMFFNDRPRALSEMMRVLKSRGSLVVAVWDSLENNPGYNALVNLIQRLLGEDVANLLRAPFILGDRKNLLKLFNEAAIPSPSLTTKRGTAKFPSIKSWVFTDVKGWTMSEMISDNQFEELLEEADKELGAFVSSDGSVSFDMPAHIVTSTKT